MRTTAADVAAYIEHFIDWPRDPVPYYVPRVDYPAWGPRPSAEDLAKLLVADVGFRALRLADWFGTDRGQLIAEAIKLVSPPFLRRDEELLLESFSLAVQLQSLGRWRLARGVALTGCIAGGAALLLASGR